MSTAFYEIERGYGCMGWSAGWRDGISRVLWEKRECNGNEDEKRGNVPIIPPSPQAVKYFPL